jgi:hypothetical protein
VLNEDLGHLLQGAGIEEVVGAQSAQDVAARPVEPLYQRVGLPFVWFAHPVSALTKLAQALVQASESMGGLHPPDRREHLRQAVQHLWPVTGAAP